MTSLYFLFLFLLLNSIWLIYIWKTDNTTEDFSPKFISSSYDEKLKIEFKSRVLQSLSPYLLKLFPSSSSIITAHTGDIPIGTLTMSEQLKREKEYNISFLHKSDIGKNRLNSEYEMFIDEKKKNIFILKIHVIYNYSNDISIISMYTTPIDNFIISTREEYNLNKSCINQMWEQKIEGIIQKYSISQDKKYLGIIINKIKKNEIITTIKYIELFNINNTSIKNLNTNLMNDTINNNKDNSSYIFNNNLMNDIIIKNKDNNTLLNSTNITNEKINTNINQTNNLINNDEIIVDGNIPLINIDVTKDTIVLSRERKEFVDILIKNNSNNKWKEYDINEIFRNKNNNLTNEAINNDYNKSIITYYNRINSFKILEDDNDKISILELYISIKSRGIFANSVVIYFDKKNYSLEIIDCFHYRLDKQSDDELEKNISYIYDIKSSLMQLKEDYFHNSIFSKNSLNYLDNSNKNLIFEFFHRTIVSLNISSLELEKIATLSLGIKSINSDQNNNNLISIDKKKNIYYFYKRNDDDIYEDYIIINLNNIPKKYRKSEILSSFIETFEKDKTRLFILLNKGVIISLDFEKLIKKMNRNIITIIFSDYFYSIFMMIFNLLILIIVLKKRRKKKQRNNDIRNAINNLGNLRRD